MYHTYTHLPAPKNRAHTDRSSIAYSYDTFWISGSSITLVKRASFLDGCVHSQTLIVCGSVSSPSLPGWPGSLKVTMNKASAEISIASTPFECGLNMLLIGVPDAVSHTTIMLSWPASAVATHFLLWLTATAQMGLQCPCHPIEKSNEKTQQKSGTDIILAYFTLT